MRILILNGHDKFGNGGTVSKIYGTEEQLTRDFSNYLKIELDRVGNETTIYNPTMEDKSAYTNLKNGERINFLYYDYIIELHFNSKGGDQIKDGKMTGSEILLHPNASNIQLAKDILISLDENGVKSRGVKFRNDLLVMNRAHTNRIPYMLWEVCFIDDNDDMAFYSSHRQFLSKIFARHFSEIGGELFTVNINDKETLPLYDSTSEKNKSVILNIPSHDQVEMISFDSTWSKVSYKNKYIGYVDTSKLFRIWKGKTTATLNVRENASELTKSITVLSKNTEVTVLHTRLSPMGDNWLYIRHNDIFGYVHLDYISPK
ncbi:MAG: N-acetylmuramoyl-L-alanine amidase [Clostridium sp.]|nr:N-acetylmuramoyl-L-alanine amidase [Clostridium sp.]